MPVPSGLYLEALCSRLATTCVSRATSPCSHTGCCGTATLQRLAAAVDEGLHRLHALRDHRVQVDRLALQHDLALADARDVEQFLDQARQLPAAGARRCPAPRSTLGSGAATRRITSHRGVDRRQRVAQLVRHHREELVLALVGFAAAPPARPAARRISRCRHAVQARVLEAPSRPARPVRRAGRRRRAPRRRRRRDGDQHRAEHALAEDQRHGRGRAQRRQAHRRRREPERRGVERVAASASARRDAPAARAARRAAPPHAGSERRSASRSTLRSLAARRRPRPAARRRRARRRPAAARPAAPARAPAARPAGSSPP